MQRRTGFDTDIVGHEFENDWAMVGRPSVERVRLDTAQTTDNTSVETQGQHIVGDVRWLSWSNVAKAGEKRRTNGIEIADDRCWAL
ncbi:MAG: hypothetical protein ACREML_02360 [Vulcanimicrobiaceae bacterium]